MPRGLRESERLEPLIFSPATKAVTGHDENITVSRMAEIVGGDAARELERHARRLRTRREIAERRGIIIADTKFEFGSTPSGEILRRRGSRPIARGSGRRLRAGRSQPSFDKQLLRDYLDEKKAGRWDGEEPPPTCRPRSCALRATGTWTRPRG